MIGPSTARLVDLCRAAERDLGPGPAREQIVALGERLSEPRVRVAVGGRMNSGKSTLVNALLRQRLAATGSTETTTLVTWFRYAYQDRLRLHLRDGSTKLVPAAPGGGVPSDSRGWGVDPGEVTHVTVEASNAALDSDHTIIDTPGLDSPSDLDHGSLDALAHADAVIYLMPHPGENDAEAVDAVRAWSGSVHFSAASMIGVLSRIDTLGSGDEDPWPAARRVARRYAEDLATSFADVLPVAGLLAETALGADFSEADTRALGALAVADRFDVEEATTSADVFARWADAPIGAASRSRLVGLLGLHGVRTSLELIDQGHTSTRALLDCLRRVSGIDPLLDRVQWDFVAGADRLRAASGVAALRVICWSQASDPAGVLRKVQAEVDRLCSRPEMRQIELGRALADLDAGRFHLRGDDVGRLKALVSGRDLRGCLALAPDATDNEVEHVADACIARWRTLEMQPYRLLQRHARAARELCEQLFLGD